MKKNQVKVPPISSHIILELYDCTSSILDDPKKIKDLLIQTVKKANTTLIETKVHKFSPYGVSGFALISESHISIHTWPEVNYAAVDIYTCGKNTLPDVACEFLIKELKSKRPSITKIIRGAYAEKSKNID